ncbi:MAG: hypothetical protein Q9160_001374 [Pyrenula sp. 1 TL-2023]
MANFLIKYQIRLRLEVQVLALDQTSLGLVRKMLASFLLEYQAKSKKPNKKGGRKNARGSWEKGTKSFGDTYKPVVEENVEVEEFGSWLKRNVDIFRRSIDVIHRGERFETVMREEHLEKLRRRETEARHEYKDALKQEEYRSTLDHLLRHLRHQDKLSRDRRTQFISSRNDILEDGIQGLMGCEGEDTFTEQYQTTLLRVSEAGTDYGDVLSERKRTYEESWRQWWGELKNTTRPFSMKSPFWYPYAYVDQSLLHLNPEIWARAAERENGKNFRGRSRLH